MRFYVELSPAGGYNVKLEGADAPVSHHDTAEEAEAKLLAYARGVERRAPPPDPSGELVTLRDGTTVLIRPVLSEDKPLFTAGFEHLGERSRYRRFMGPKKQLTARELAFLTEVDHHDHEALGAIDPETGAGVAVARFMRVPGDRVVAEAAVAVVDAWQGRGLGGALLRRLAHRAVEEGIHRFTASLFTSNREMLHLFERLGELVIERAEAGAYVIQVSLPLGAELQEALRAAAAREVGP
jgi:RimJ/RimL family protein N-acetyltransferase